MREGKHLHFLLRLVVSQPGFFFKPGISQVFHQVCQRIFPIFRYLRNDSIRQKSRASPARRVFCVLIQFKITTQVGVVPIRLTPVDRRRYQTCRVILSLTGLAVNHPRGGKILPRLTRAKSEYNFRSDPVRVQSTLHLKKPCLVQITLSSSARPFFFGCTRKTLCRNTHASKQLSFVQQHDDTVRHLLVDSAR